MLDSFKLRQNMLKKRLRSVKRGFLKLNFKIILKKRILPAMDEVENLFKFFWPVSKSMGPSGVSDGLLCLKM